MEASSKVTALTMLDAYSKMLELSSVNNLVSDKKINANMYKFDIQTYLKDLVDSGAEGLMLRTPDSPYQTGRTNHLLKMKLRKDAEARVIAYQSGRGKFENMMGAIWVEMEDGTLFKIGTGFTNQDRQNPPAIGSDITYSYQGFTEKGLPRFASFERVKAPE